MSENNNVLPQLYIIVGPVAAEPSERARQLKALTGGSIYFSGGYFIRPDGNFGYSTYETPAASYYLAGKVRKYLASGLGKSLIIDGVTGSLADELVDLGLAAGWTVVVGEKTYIPAK